MVGRTNDSARVFIINPHYDTENEEENSAIFEARLAQEFNCQLEEVNIGAEADWPAWLLEIPLAELGITSLAIGALYAGERIEKSFDAWIRLSKRVMEGVYRKRLDRNAAFSLALAATAEKLGVSNPSKVRLLSYRRADAFFEKIEDARVEVDDAPIEFQGRAMHVFDIEIEDKAFKVSVVGTDVSIETEEPESNP